jgi:hypothetical protein
MKFIKVTTKHTREQIDKIVSQMDSWSLKNLAKLYDSFKYIEFSTEKGSISMYATIPQDKIEHLFSEYIKWSIDFSFEDITKFVLFGDIPEIIGEQKSADLNALIKKFKEENLDTNTVLDKISENGIHSLTEQDKIVLRSC